MRPYGFFDESTVAENDAETTLRVAPGDATFAARVTGDLAGAALQAVLVPHGDVVIHPLVNKRRANRQAGFQITGLAALLVHLNVALFFVYLVFIQPEAGIQS
jgi:hypothetical protein